MLVKRLTFSGLNFNGGVSNTEFTAWIVVHGNPSGEPLATLGDIQGPPIQDVFARWGDVEGDFGKVHVVVLTVRFHSNEILSPDGGLNCAIAVNLAVEGATDYIIKWF